MEITKEGAQSLRMKMPNADLYLKEATVIYSFHPRGARLPELASKLERLAFAQTFKRKRKQRAVTNITIRFRMVYLT